MPKYILASASPRRKQLLEWAELDFEVVVHPTDESYPANLTLEEVAVHIAEQKAAGVEAQVNSNQIIIAADTIVVLENEIIGKPQNRQHGIETLLKLSGKEHTVVTGVAILKAGKQISFYDVTKVEFHTLTEDQIAFYFDKYKPYDKAGAYAIQEWIGVVGIKKITGDFYNVMGLPVSRVVQALERFE